MPKKLLVLLLVAAVAFGWGLATAHFRWFPYRPLVAAATHVRGWLGHGDGDAPDKPEVGLWGLNRNRDGRGIATDDIHQMANMPYLSGFEDAPDAEGVTEYDTKAAQDGINLVVSGDKAHASLRDMNGHVLHEWHRSFDEIWPNLQGFDRHPGQKTFWRRAHVFPNGDLLAIFDGIGMVELDKDSNVRWANPGHYHHDMFVDEQGDIWTISRHERKQHPDFELKGPIEEDFICVLSPDGKEKSRLSVLSCFLNSDYRSTLAAAAHQGDIMHVNTIELMDGRFADRMPMFAKGNVLISAAAINTIAVIDPRQKKVVWALEGMSGFQHQPTMLDNGHMLVFDNIAQKQGSKVMELDPLTQQIVWAYRNSPEHPLWSYFLGSCQRLQNGNTLITESTAGRALEVQPDGTTVWEFVNPERAGDHGELIATLLEVVRIDPSYFRDEFTKTFARTSEPKAVTEPVK